MYSEILENFAVSVLSAFARLWAFAKVVPLGCLWLLFCLLSENATGRRFRHLPPTAKNLSFSLWVIELDFEYWLVDFCALGANCCGCTG
jgi:hypothetical protein